MKDIRSQHIFSILTVSLLFYGYLPAAAFASSFSVDPSLTTILKTNFPITRTISLSNLSDQTEYISSQIMAIRQDAQGQAVFIPDSDVDSYTKLLLQETSLSAKNLTLLPEETKQLKLTISSNIGQLLNRDYYFSVLFISKDTYSPGSSGNQVKASLLQEPAIASLFMVSVTPPEENGLDAQLTQTSPAWKNVLSPRIKIENNTNSLAQLAVQTTITDFLGGKYISQYKANNYLFAHASRVISFTNLSLPFSFFGPATITVKIHDAHAGTDLTRSKRILIIPLAFWAILLLCLSSAILFIKRVQSRLAKQRDQ